MSTPNRRVIGISFRTVRPLLTSEPITILRVILERPDFYALGGKYAWVEDANAGDLVELTARGFINPQAGDGP